MALTGSKGSSIIFQLFRDGRTEWILTFESRAADIFHSAINRFSTVYQPGYQPLHPIGQRAAAGHEPDCSSHWRSNEFSGLTRWMSALAPNTHSNAPTD
jgi:hypothetical protein